MTLQIPAMAEVKPTVLSTVIVGLMAMVFFLFFKYVANAVKIPLLQSVANAL